MISQRLKDKLQELKEQAAAEGVYLHASLAYYDHDDADFSTAVHGTHHACLDALRDILVASNARPFAWRRGYLTTRVSLTVEELGASEKLDKFLTVVDYGPEKSDEEADLEVLAWLVEILMAWHNRTHDSKLAITDTGHLAWKEQVAQ